MIRVTRYVPVAGALLFTAMAMFAHTGAAQAAPVQVDVSQLDANTTYYLDFELLNPDSVDAASSVAISNFSFADNDGTLGSVFGKSGNWTGNLDTTLTIDHTSGETGFYDADYIEAFTLAPGASTLSFDLDPTVTTVNSDATSPDTFNFTIVDQNFNYLGDFNGEAASSNFTTTSPTVQTFGVTPPAPTPEAGSGVALGALCSAGALFLRKRGKLRA